MAEIQSYSRTLLVWIDESCCDRRDHVRAGTDYMFLISVIIFWRSSSYCSFVITDFSKNPLNLLNCSIHWLRHTSLLPGDTPAEVEEPALIDCSVYFSGKMANLGGHTSLLPGDTPAEVEEPALIDCSVYFSGKMANLGGHRKNALPFVSDVPRSAASPLYSFQSVFHLSSQILIQPHPV